MHEQFSQRARLAFAHANASAQTEGHDLSPAHLLYGFLKVDCQAGWILWPILEPVGEKDLVLNRANIYLANDERFPTVRTGGKGPVITTAVLKQGIKRALALARNAHACHIGTHHLLAAILQDDRGSASKMLDYLGKQDLTDQVRAKLKEVLATEPSPEETPADKVAALLLGQPLEPDGLVEIAAIGHKVRVPALLAACLVIAGKDESLFADLYNNLELKGWRARVAQHS